MAYALPIKIRAVVRDVRTGGGEPLVVLEPLIGGKIELRIPDDEIAERFELGAEFNVYISPALSNDERLARVEAWASRPQNEGAEPPPLACA